MKRPPLPAPWRTEADALFAALKRRRLAAGRTLAEAGRALGVSAQSVAKLESGITCGSLAQFLALAAFVGWQPEDVVVHARSEGA